LNKLQPLGKGFTCNDRLGTDPTEEYVLHDSVRRHAMNGKVLLGIVIVVIGLIAAAYGIAGRSEPNEPRNEAVIVGDQNQPAREEALSMLIPVLAGVSIAAGATLIGIGMGNFRRPKIVPADSPNASRAATTRGTLP
jgi:hypothetical protein